MPKSASPAGGGLLLLGVRRLRGAPTRMRGPYDTRALADGNQVVAAVQAALADTTWVRTGRSGGGFRIAVFDGESVRELRSGVEQVKGPEPVPAALRLLWHLPDPAITAAEGLAVLCELIVAAEPGLDAERFVERLAEQGAGIAPGRAGWADLIRAGHNRLPGGGFDPEYDDGSLGQVRHFAGSCAGALRLGRRVTAVASLARGDLPGSPDHALTTQAIAFVEALRSGELAPYDAGDWVRQHLL